MGRVAAAMPREPLGTGALGSLSWSAFAFRLSEVLLPLWSHVCMTRPRFFPALLISGFWMNNGTCAWKRHNIVSCFMFYILWDDCPSPNPGPGWMDQRLPCFRDSLGGSSESGSCGGGRFQKVGGNVLHHSLLETP